MLYNENRARVPQTCPLQPRATIASRSMLALVSYLLYLVAAALAIRQLLLVLVVSNDEGVNARISLRLNS